MTLWHKKRLALLLSIFVIGFFGVFFFLVWRSISQATPAFADLKTVVVNSYAAEVIKPFRSGRDSFEFKDDSGSRYETLGVEDDQESKIKSALKQYQQLTLRYGTRFSPIPPFHENLIYQIETPDTVPISYKEIVDELAGIREGSPWVLPGVFAMIVATVLYQAFEKGHRKKGHVSIEKS